MEKFGKILLFFVNVGINLFLLSIVVVIFLWLVMGVSPNESVQYGARWIEQKWYSLWHSEAHVIPRGVVTESTEQGKRDV